MILQLPNEERIDLDNDCCLEEKMEKVNELILQFDESIAEGWDSNRIRFFLNGLSNYIVWHKEEKYQRDPEVLSKTKDLRMKKYDPKNINFSLLSNVDKDFIGLDFEYDSNYNEE